MLREYIKTNILTMFWLILLVQVSVVCRKITAAKTEKIVREQRVANARQRVDARVQARAQDRALSTKERAERFVKTFEFCYRNDMPMQRFYVLRDFGFDIERYQRSNIKINKILRTWRKKQPTKSARQKDIATIFQNKHESNKDVAVWTDFEQWLQSFAIIIDYVLPANFNAARSLVEEDAARVDNQYCKKLAQACDRACDQYLGIGRGSSLEPIVGTQHLLRIIRLIETDSNLLKYYKFIFMDLFLHHSDKIVDDAQTLVDRYTALCDAVRKQYLDIECFIARLAHFGQITKISLCDWSFYAKQNQALEQMRVLCKNGYTITAMHEFLNELEVRFAAMFIYDERMLSNVVNFFVRQFKDKFDLR